MSQSKPKVILTRKLPETIETRMRELFDTTLNDSDKALSRDELEMAVKTADVLVPTVTDKIDADLIAKAGSQLRLIASFGTGVDHIDLGAANARGITVTNTPGVLTEDTADVTMALILAVPRRIAEGDALARSGQWQGWSPTGMLGHRINGKRLGIVGMGRMAKRLRVARADLACRFIIITGNRFTQRLKPNLRQHIGSHSNRCWHGLILCRSIARIRRQQTIYYRVNGCR